MDVNGRKLRLEAKHTLRRLGHSVKKEFSADYIIPGFADEKSWQCYLDTDDVFVIEAPLTQKSEYKVTAEDYPKFTTRVVLNDPRNSKFSAETLSDRGKHQSSYQFTDSRPKQVAGPPGTKIQARRFEPLSAQNFRWSDYEDTRGRDFSKKLKAFRDELASFKRLGQSRTIDWGRNIDLTYKQSDAESPTGGIWSPSRSRTAVRANPNLF